MMPAYANEALELLAAGRGALHVCAGPQAWQRGKALRVTGGAVVVVPPERKPNCLTWGRLANDQIIYVHWTGSAFDPAVALQLAESLLCAGAILVGLDREGPRGVAWFEIFKALR